MLHAQALVYSDDPSALGERIAGGLAGPFRTQWSAEAGSVASDDGVCELHAWPEALRLDAYAENDAALDRIETAVSGAIGKVAGVSSVDWYRRYDRAPEGTSGT